MGSETPNDFNHELDRNANRMGVAIRPNQISDAMKRHKSIKTLDALLERPPAMRGKRDSLKVLQILDAIAKEPSGERPQPQAQEARVR